LAVMGIMSFIPYFNWLVSKVFFFFWQFLVHIQSPFCNKFESLLIIWLIVELGFCLAWYW
jgi:hypothetical protein